RADIGHQPLPGCPGLLAGGELGPDDVESRVHRLADLGHRELEDDDPEDGDERDDLEDPREAEVSAGEHAQASVPADSWAASSPTTLSWRPRSTWSPRTRSAPSPTRSPRWAIRPSRSCRRSASRRGLASSIRRSYSACPRVLASSRNPSTVRDASS